MVLPILEKHLNTSELEDMGVVLDGIKTISPTHPHPNAPNTPPGNIVVGPIAAFMDRIRDLARSFPNSSK